MVKNNKMKYKISWLPKLIEFDENKEPLDKYIDGIYQIFVEEFINQGIYFKGERLGMKRLPKRDNKEATFYHIVSEGEDENNRNIDIERCARIKWPRAILASNYVGLKIWKNKRKNKKNLLIYFEEINYLIVIRLNPNEKLFWTAYPINKKHRKEKLLKEYHDYMKTMQKSPQ